MGKHFGNLQRLKGVTYYVLSPTELKPFAGIISPGFKNTLRRIYSNLFLIGIPASASFLAYYYVSNEYYKTTRKNPDDFKDDE